MIGLLGDFWRGERRSVARGCSAVTGCGLPDLTQFGCADRGTVAPPVRSALYQ